MAEKLRPIEFVCFSLIDSNLRAALISSWYSPANTYDASEEYLY
jgi:hypothetical protein